MLSSWAENIGREDVTLVEDLNDGHADTGTSSDDLHVVDDFDGTTSNLRGDTECLEERGLAGLHTSVTSGNGDIEGSEGTSTSGGSNLVGRDDVTDLLEVTGREDETDVALDVGEETLEGGELREDGAERTADHGVLAHDDNTLAAESDTDLMHLVRADVVDIDDED